MQNYIKYPTYRACAHENIMYRVRVMRARYRPSKGLYYKKNTIKTKNICINVLVETKIIVPLHRKKE